MSNRGGIDWGTVERSDVDLPQSIGSPEVLEVPELTEELLQQLDNDDNTPDEPETPVQTGEPGSQVECERCGKNVRVRRDGNLSIHKCEAKPGRGDRLGNVLDLQRRRTTPDKVHKFGIGVISWAVEEGSAHALARPFGADPDDVPTELPDPELMIGTPLDILWPDIPDGAQKFISKIADNADLIACALAWGEWLSTVGGWARSMRAYQHSLEQERTQHGTGNSAAATANGGRLLPFTPTVE